MSASPETIQRRNNLLYSFFNTIFPNKIVLIDYDPNEPSVIYNDEKCLSCYVHNFELRFTDVPDKGKVVYTISLDDIRNYNVQNILEWLKYCEHRKMWKVKFDNMIPELYLSGYNFIDRVKKEGKYPVFSRHHPKVYFQQSKAQEVVDSLRKEGYFVISC